MKKKNLIQYFIRITEEMRNEIDSLCEIEDRNMSNMTRILIKEALHNRKKDNKLLM